MGILDDAIREHLELKRQHGAAETELEQLEGEAFGPAERPGSEEGDSALAEAPTEFMAAPEVAEGKAEAASSRPEPGPSIADLQEAPEPKPEPEPEPEKPAEEEAPAMEHEAVPEPEPAVSQEGPSTEERQAIADPPTELYDVEGEEFGSEPQAPSDEALAEEEEVGEPRLAPAEALPPLEDDSPQVEAEDDEDDFFDEKRLSDELDEAMDAPLETQHEDVELEDEDEPKYEEDEHEKEPESEEAPLPRAEEDVLEETPDFLEEAPEDDQLWFEQKPPKDFDFDD